MNESAFKDAGIYFDFLIVAVKIVAFAASLIFVVTGFLAMKRPVLLLRTS